MKKIITLILLCSFINSNKAQSGALDVTFDTDGIATASVGLNAADWALGVALQSDGKIVVAGYTDPGGNASDFAVVRFNSDGSLDNTFDGDGKVTTNVGSNDFGTAIAIQNDGKILVAGYSNNGGNYDFAIVRYNTNGSLDNTFDGDGKVITPIGADSDYARAIKLQSDGKIVVTGDLYVGINNDIAVVRYNSDGSLDTSFDGDGKVITVISNDMEGAKSLAIQNDGKILVGGFTKISGNQDFAVIRYNTNGSLDNSFDSDGIVTTQVGTGDDSGAALAIQSDGKIILVGETNVGSTDNFGLVRYNTDGSLDVTFDGDGKQTTTIGASADDSAKGVAVLSDGKILLAGSTNSTPSNKDFALACYNTNGSLDVNFDTDGKLASAIGAGSDVGRALAIQSDGKIVVAGSSSNGTNNDIAVARYLYSSSTNINKNFKEDETIAYPCPASSHVNIICPLTTITEVIITDITGKQITTSYTRLENELSVFTGLLKSGVYTLTIKGDKEVLIKKIVINN